MFFVEDLIAREVAIKEDNVYTYCPDCGEKVYVDLSIFLKCEDTNLNDELVCKNCYERHYK